MKTTTILLARACVQTISRWIQGLQHDLPYAFRVLSRSGGFTLIALVSLAVAIGLNTAIFSYANKLLLVRLGIPHAEELRTIRLIGDDHIAMKGTWAAEWNGSYRGEDGRFYLGVFPYPAYKSLRLQNHSVQDIFAFTQVPGLSISGYGAPETRKVELVSGNFYEATRINPELGRGIARFDDGAEGSGAVAVISDRFWHNAFGGAASVLGKTIRVSGVPLTIVGVNPREFIGPEGMNVTPPDVFVPLSMTARIIGLHNEPSLLVLPNTFWIQLMARAKPGLSTVKAEAELNSLFRAAFLGTASVNSGETVPTLVLQDGSRGVTDGMESRRKTIILLIVLAGLVLLIANANVASLMLARATARQREMSVRVALGAPRGRILRQVLTEQILLATIAGGAGLALGYVTRNVIPSLLETGWGQVDTGLSFDWRVFSFACCITLMTTVLSGLLPALRSVKSVNPDQALRDVVRTAPRSSRSWSGRAIVIFQLALSTMLIVAASAFLRTLSNLNSVEPGFATHNLLLVEVNPPRGLYPAPKLGALHARVEDAFSAIPGVEGVSYINQPLGADAQWLSQFQVESAQQDLNIAQRKSGYENELANVSVVGGRFFSDLSIPILIGRGFGPQDTELSPPVSVVTLSLAKKFFPNTSAIGKHFFRGMGDKQSRMIEIIGICSDIRSQGPRHTAQPTHFDLDRQSPVVGPVTYMIHFSSAQDGLVPALRKSLQTIDPDLPLSNIRTLQQQLAANMEGEMLFASLSSGFGMLSLALACVGVYGLMAYTVSLRTGEIGVRFAMGATRKSIHWMVLRETGVLASLGILIGASGSVALMTVVRSMLYGVSSSDPIALVASSLLLFAISLVAGCIPAYRASSLEPARALRQE